MFKVNNKDTRTTPMMPGEVSPTGQEYTQSSSPDCIHNN